MNTNRESNIASKTFDSTASANSKTNKIKKKVVWKINDDPIEDVKFINEMCQNGWKLVLVESGSRFVFEPCEPGIYVCQFAWVINKNGLTNKQKLECLETLLTESGDEIVKQKGIFGMPNCIYSLHDLNNGPLVEIYSNLDAKIEDWKSRRNYQIFLAVFWVIIGSALMLTKMGTVSRLIFGILLLIALCFYLYKAYKNHKTLKRLEGERNIHE